MSIEIRTDAYQRSHGTTPKGRGMWGFIVEATRDRAEHTIWTPSNLTLTEAKALCRKRMREAGYQDATLQVAP